MKNAFLVLLVVLFLGNPVFALEGVATGSSRPSSPESAPGKNATETLASANSQFLFLPGEVASTPTFIAPDPFSTTLSVLTSLIIVLLLVFGLSWFLQRQVGLNRSVFGKILGVLPLDGRRFIYLVDIMGKILVLGVTEHQINLLCEVTEKATVDALRLKAETSTVPALEKLFPFLKKKKPDEDVIPEADFAERAEMTKQQKQAVEKLLLRREPPKGPPEDRLL